MKNIPGSFMEATNEFYGQNWPWTKDLGIFFDVIGTFLMHPNGTGRYSYVGERKPIITFFFYTIVNV